MQNKNNQELYEWCLDQAIDRYMGTLSEEQFNLLQAIEFPWGYYEDELDKLGFNWAKNNPNGVRYGK